MKRYTSSDLALTIMPRKGKIS